MRVCLSFSHNAFAGVVCDNCKLASNPPLGIGRGVFSNHRLRKHNDGNHDLDVGVQVDKVFGQASTVAELHHSLEQDSGRYDLYIRYWSTDFHTVFWCNACNTGFNKKDSHRTCGQLVPVNARRLLDVKHAKVFLRETHQTLIEMERLFSVSHKEALASPNIRAAGAANDSMFLDQPMVRLFVGKALNVVYDTLST
jgi:hypothetical protein